MLLLLQLAQKKPPLSLLPSPKHVAQSAIGMRDRPEEFHIPLAAAGDHRAIGEQNVHRLHLSGPRRDFSSTAEGGLDPVSTWSALRCRHEHGTGATAKQCCSANGGETYATFGAPGIATGSDRTLLGAPGLTARSKKLLGTRTLLLLQLEERHVLRFSVRWSYSVARGSAVTSTVKTNHTINKNTKQ